MATSVIKPDGVHFAQIPWTPEIKAGDTVITPDDVQAYAFRSGQLIFLSLLVWCSPLSGNTEEVSVSLPAGSAVPRLYGPVGYFANSASFPNLHTIIPGQGASIMKFEYGSGGSIAIIKGSEIGHFQCSLLYVTSQ